MDENLEVLFVLSVCVWLMVTLQVLNGCKWVAVCIIRILYIYYKYVYNYRHILRHTLGFHMFGLWECGPGGLQDYTPQLQPSSIKFGLQMLSAF